MMLSVDQLENYKLADAVDTEGQLEPCQRLLAQKSLKPTRLTEVA